MKPLSTRYFKVALVFVFVGCLRATDTAQSNPDQKPNQAPTLVPTQQLVPTNASGHKLSAAQQMLYATVRIEGSLPDGETTIGTGFLFQFTIDKSANKAVPVIVTNKHVVAGTMQGTFYLHLADEQGHPLPGKNTPIPLDNFASRWIPHPDGVTDLCVLPIAPILTVANENHIKIFIIYLSEDLIPSDDELADIDPYQPIAMVGYPIGLWDKVNNMPIVRAGIIATEPEIDYEGRPEFMIDAACMPGSSGSPVLLWNTGSYTTKNTTQFGMRIKFLGILWGGPTQTARGEIRVENIPTRQVPRVYSELPANLGFVIKSRKLLDFKALFEKMILANEPGAQVK